MPTYTHVIYQTPYRRVNTDPQRRCYNGCHFKSEIVKGTPEKLERCISLEHAQERLTFWRDLNDYAVGCRGESARRDFEIVPLGET